MTPAITPLVTADGTPTQEEIQAALEAQGVRAEQLVATFAEADQTATMPTTGTATYSGAIGFVEGTVTPSFTSEDFDISADLAMTADFAGSTVSGEAANFAGQGDSVQFLVAQGAVPLTGTINGATLSASGSGTLVVAGESNEAALSLDGDFAGANAAAMRGTANLGVLSSEVGASREEFRGVFIAGQ